MSDKCPKCGAVQLGRIDRYSCGTTNPKNRRPGNGSSAILIGRTCRIRQLAQAHAKIAELEAVMSEVIEYCETCRGLDAHDTQRCARCLTFRSKLEEARDQNIDAAELASLRAIVDKLRKTDNGASMVPGGKYWAWCRDNWAGDDSGWQLYEVIWWQGGGDDHYNPEFVFANPAENTEYWESFEVGTVYSTRSAAEAAMDGEGARDKMAALTNRVQLNTEEGELFDAVTGSLFRMSRLLTKEQDNG